MTENRRILWKIYDAILAIILVAGCIYIFMAPLSSSTYEDGGYDYEFKLNIIGNWDLLRDGTINNEGTVDDLGNYPTYATYMVIAAILLIFVPGFLVLWFISKNASMGTHSKAIRISCILQIIVCLIGLVGMIILTTYTPTLVSSYGPTQYSAGFYVAIVYFSVMALIVLIPLIKPNIFSTVAHHDDLSPLKYTG